MTVKRAAAAAGAALVYLFLLLPLIAVLPASFSRSMDFTFPPHAWSLHWYQALLGDTRLQHSLWLSLGIALATAVLASAVGTAAALGIARKSLPLADLWESLFMGPLIVPFVVTGLALLLLFVRASVAGQAWTIVAGHITLTLPYVMRSTLASLRMSDADLEEAARVHGATPWYAFRTVVLPQLRPGMVAGAILAFLISMDEFTVTIFLASPETVTLPIRIYQYVALDINPTVMALSSVLIVVSMAAIALLDRRLAFHRYLEF